MQDRLSPTSSSAPRAATGERVARLISILGHPLLVLPAAMLAAARTHDLQALLATALGCALFAALVLGLSWRQVRRGRWAHVDASGQRERRSLNRGLLALLLLGTLLAGLVEPAPEVPLALAIAAAIVALAILGAPWCKLSLHMAFAVYAAGLLWPLGPAAPALGLGFAAAVAWSRLRLSRHDPRDLVAGGFAGMAAALAYWPVLEALRG